MSRQDRSRPHADGLRSQVAGTIPYPRLPSSWGSSLDDPQMRIAVCRSHVWLLNFPILLERSPRELRLVLWSLVIQEETPRRFRAWSGGCCSSNPWAFLALHGKRPVNGSRSYCYAKQAQSSRRWRELCAVVYGGAGWSGLRYLALLYRPMYSPHHTSRSAKWPCWGQL